MIHAKLHHGVDRLRSSDAFHHAIRGFVDEWHQHAIRNEARRVVHGHRRLAKFLGQFHGQLKRFIARLQRANDFHELHHRHGIHEMHANEAFGAPGQSGERGHRDGRSV